MVETQNIEYKVTVTDDLEKEVVAFLNHIGGVIYIGIDKSGNIVGVEDADQVQLTVKDRLKYNISPSIMGLFDLSVEKRNEDYVVKLIVAGGSEKPYHIKKYGLSQKGTFIRVGSASEPMPTGMIEHLFSRRIRNSIGNIRSPKQDLQFEQLKIYYDAQGKTLNEQFAKSLDLTLEDGAYNYVAYLMSDANTVSVKTAKYSGLNRVDLIENNEYGFGSLVRATKSLLDKADIENKTLTRITAKEREDRRLWNEIALREAIINAMVHNDYTRELAPKMEFFEDRIEITSYGGLPEGLNQDDFFSGISVPRNKEIMRIYRDLELVEQLGSGIPRILEAYGKECFHFSENYMRMTFPAGITSEGEKVVQNVAQNVTQNVAQNVTQNVTQNVVENVTKKREIQIIEMMRRTPSITTAQIAEALGVTKRTIMRDVEKLRNDLKIEYVGPAKGGFWKIM